MSEKDDELQNIIFHPARAKQVPGRSYFLFDPETSEEESQIRKALMVDQCKIRAQQDTAMRMLEAGISEERKYHTVTVYPVANHPSGGHIVVIIQTAVHRNKWDFSWDVAFCPTPESIAELQFDSKRRDND